MSFSAVQKFLSSLNLWHGLGLVCVFFLLVFTIFMVTVFIKEPISDRDWSPSLTKVARFTPVQKQAKKFRLENVRRWEYGLEGLLRKEWEAQEYDLNTLKEVWFFLEPFESNPAFAHSFLSFVFEGENGETRALSVSVEARKEKGEAYSAIKGIFRKFELLYVWSTEKDVLTRISVKLDHSLYAYKLDLKKEQAIAIFEHFIERTNKLAENPRFYNTLHSNCTNELAKGVNQSFPGALPWSFSWIMTGRSAHWLYHHGFIKKQDVPFADIAARSDIHMLVRRFSDKPVGQFDDLWRKAYQGF